MRVVPQVSAFSADQDRTPKAGVGSSNLPRRTECSCRSAMCAWAIAVVVDAVR